MVISLSLFLPLSYTDMLDVARHSFLGRIHSYILYEYKRMYAVDDRKREGDRATGNTLSFQSNMP